MEWGRWRRERGRNNKDKEKSARGGDRRGRTEIERAFATTSWEKVVRQRRSWRGWPVGDREASARERTPACDGYLIYLVLVCVSFFYVLKKEQFPFVKVVFSTAVVFPRSRFLFSRSFSFLLFPPPHNPHNPYNPCPFVPTNHLFHSYILYLPLPNLPFL